MSEVIEDLGFKVPSKSSTGKSYHYYLFKCLECTDGLVEATHDNYYRGLSTRCPECIFKARGIIHAKSQEVFLTQVRELHPNLNFDATEYTGDANNVTCTCDIHGEVVISASGLIQGKGCAKCSWDHIGRLKIQEASERFIPKALAKYNGLYGYTRFIYKTAKTPGLVTCDIHGDYLKSPDKHLRGQGCPKCSNSGFQQGKPAILYYICIDDTYYKIGITNYSVIDRFKCDCDISRIRIIKEWYYEEGSEALAQEVKIKREYKYARYHGDKLLKNTGNTEIYTHDILLLDTEYTLSVT